MSHKNWKFIEITGKSIYEVLQTCFWTLFPNNAGTVYVTKVHTPAYSVQT